MATTGDYMQVIGPVVQYGWMCPRCSTVYAPYVRSCTQCIVVTVQPYSTVTTTTAAPSDVTYTTWS